MGCDRTSRGAVAVAIAAIAIACAGGCAEQRDGPIVVDLVTWTDDIGPLAAARCGSCHGGATPAGGYDLTSYLGALGTGTDTVANAIAGEPGSAILTILVSGDGVHDTFADAAPALRAWVVDSRLAYRDSRIHDPGLLNPADPHFHGAELAARGWSFALCATCHGEDFSGGTSGAACTTCHLQGPTACDTCHGAIPASGAHAAHVTGPELDRPVDCAECHHVPARWDEPGHILDASGAVDPPPAEVVFGALANRDLDPPRRTAPASFDPVTLRCANVYCHGGVLADPNAADPTPTWTDGPVAVTCGGCHGAPPATHAQSDCAVCHSQTVGAGGALAAAHLDGAIETGDGSGACTGCHGGPASPAPPRGLHGETLPSAIGVGAHAAHLSPGGLRGPITCQECHVVPATVGAAGHIDSALPAEVFPPGAGTLARADNAMPVWDRTTKTCTGVYCHGGGEKLAADPSPGQRAPVWTSTVDQAYCGACHGLPPVDGHVWHQPPLTIADCGGCHPDVDPFGNIIITNGGLTSAHMDGVVDVQ